MMATTCREVVRHVAHRSRLDTALGAVRRARGRDLGHLRVGERGPAFQYIYDHGLWRDGRPAGALSGRGSELPATDVLRRHLVPTLRRLGATSLLDVGCGDFTWMAHVDLGAIAYTGVDIVPTVVATDVDRYGSPDRRFLCLDAVADDLPEHDVALCREVLFHLSFADARQLLTNLRRAGARHLIATTDTSTSFNADITSGDFRPLNLQRRPFRFPRPLQWIDDDAVVRGRGLGIWAVEELLPC